MTSPAMPAILMLSGKQGMDADQWREFMADHLGNGDQDGPTLLLPEIMALIGRKRLWLPFEASNIIASQMLGMDVVLSRLITGDQPIQAVAGVEIDAVYFGVPTIVNNKALFFAYGWNVERARDAARRVTACAQSMGAKLIVSGLGSGDIGVYDRLQDMGGGHVVAYKNFGDFEDWVLARWL